MHASERARVLQEAAWDRELQQPVIAPNTLTEAEALAAIDLAREEEQARNGDTFAQRRRRAARYWGKAARMSRL